MKDPELITMTNTFLLSVVSIASLIISFFLKDLYHDYKRQAEKVNTLHRELHVYRKLSEELMHVAQQEIGRLHERLDRLENSCRVSEGRQDRN